MHIINKDTFFINTKTGGKWFYPKGTDLDEYSPPTDKELRDETTRFNHANESWRWHIDKLHAIEMSAEDLLIYDYDKDLNINSSAKYGTKLELDIIEALNDLRDTEISAICLLMGDKGSNEINTISLSDDLKAKIVLLKDSQEIPLVTNEDKVITIKGKQAKEALIECEIKISEIFAEYKELKLQALKTFRAKSAEETKEQKLFRICAFLFWLESINSEKVDDDTKERRDEVIKNRKFNFDEILGGLKKINASN